MYIYIYIYIYVYSNLFSVLSLRDITKNKLSNNKENKVNNIFMFGKNFVKFSWQLKYIYTR